MPIGHIIVARLSIGLFVYPTQAPNLRRINVEKPKFVYVPQESNQCAKFLVKVRVRVAQCNSRVLIVRQRFSSDSQVCFHDLPYFLCGFCSELFGAHF